MTYITSGVIGTKLTATHTSPEFQVGSRFVGTDGTEWVYVQASGAITQYDYVTIDEDFTAVAGTKAGVDDGHMIGFAQIAFATTEYGWVACKGTGISVRVLGSCNGDVALYTTSTAGKLDDSSTSQTKIDGIVAVSTNATATTAAVALIATYPKSTTF